MTPSGRPLLQVSLEPFTAAFLAVYLRPEWWQQKIEVFERQGRPQAAAALRADRARLSEALRQWKERTGSVAGTSERAESEVEAGSGHDEITAGEAATMLGVSAEMVRRRCRAGTLPGRFSGRVWLIDRGGVLADLEAKGLSA